MRTLPNRFLSKLYPHNVLKEIILPIAEWHPYPNVADRSTWEQLPERVKQAHLHQGEQALEVPWPHLEATNYLNFARNGDRRKYEKPYFLRRDILGKLALAECLENRGRFIDVAGNAIWSICEESSWCVPAHIGVQKNGSGLPDPDEPIVDLFAAETGALLAWVDYLLGSRLDRVSPLVRQRIRREVDRRILTPTLTRDDFGWMGFKSLPVNNWNPWVNSNWLACALLLESDPQRRLEAVWKILESLDCFVTPYPNDGGCDEGPSYWGRAGASLFDALELLLSVSGGKMNVYEDSRIQEIGRFVYRAHIAGNYYVNFADAPARLTPDPLLVFRYGKRIGDPKMTAFGTWLADRKQILALGVAPEGDVAPSLGRVLPALFHLNELSGEPASPPLLQEVWLPDIQVMACREEGGGTGGFYLAAKGGHNQESHNHNDIGHFIVYRDGKPVIIDVGVETYTRKTFSSKRYEIWTMQSDYHSLPSINGVMQSPGRSFAARAVDYQAGGSQTRLSLDIAGAYPPEAGLKRWLRTVTLQRGIGVEVTDSWVLEQPAQEIAFHLMTPCLVDTGEAGKIFLREAQIEEGRTSGSAQILYDAGRLAVKVDEMAIDDARLLPIWGKRLARITFVLQMPELEDQVEFRFV